MMRALVHSEAANPENQDRGAIIETSVGLVLVVADGAGGISGGTKAARIAVDYVREHAHELDSPESCADLLRRMDQVIYDDAIAGETTCVVSVLKNTRVYGAGVGDSGAWLIGTSGLVNLTEAQARKPFIGSGAACVVPFDRDLADAERLLLATDGLLKYASSERIACACLNSDHAEAGRKLIELVRYRSGALPDDVTVIVAQLR